MDGILYAATHDGVAVCRREGEHWKVSERGLRGHNATSVIAREGVALAGTRDGVYRTDNEGRSWQEASEGLSPRLVRWMAFHPDVSDFEFAGTEPAGILVSRDGGESWRACPEVFEMRQLYGWSLPYSPEAGCVRGFAFHGARGYAAVEDGGVLISDDQGETWRLAKGSRGRADHRPEAGMIHSDVHSISVHPTSEQTVFAPTGGGFYHSADGGDTWECLYPGCYCRAAWLDPHDAGHIVLGPADGVDFNGRIEETWDGGRTWLPASTGLDTPWRSHMVERFAQAGDSLVAVISNGELLSAQIKSLQWRRALPERNGVNAVFFADE